MVRNFTHDAYDLTDPRGHAMCVRLLDHVRDKMVEFQEATGHLYNLEATPAEGTTYRFAKEDRKRYPGILQAVRRPTPTTRNSSQIPVATPTTPSRPRRCRRSSRPSTPAAPSCISWASKGSSV